MYLKGLISEIANSQTLGFKKPVGKKVGENLSSLAEEKLFLKYKKTAWCTCSGSSAL